MYLCCLAMGKEMKPVTLAVCVTIITALIICTCGCMSSVNTTTSTSTASPVITIATSNASPAANQSFTLSGILTAGSTPLSGKKIILCGTDPSGVYSQPYNTTTNANGAYSFTVSEPASGTYHYGAAFPAGDGYAASLASLTLNVGDLQQSVLSVFSTNDAPAVNQSFTVYGTLQDGVSGAPLAGQSITLQVEQLWSLQSVYVVATTDANGTYSIPLSESAQGVYGLYPTFAGNPNYAPSTGYLEVTIGNPIPTTLSLNVANNNPAVNQQFTISGYLTDTNGTPLSGRAISVDVRLPSGDWTPGPGATTDANGHYSITTSEPAAGEYRYEVYFLGDGIYAGSGNWALLPIGTLQPTKISATTNVATPSAGKTFTLSGYLTNANGTPLAGKEIDLYQYAASGANPPDIFQTRFTDQNGYYSFVLNDTSGNYMYTARFPGDQTYSSSQAVVNLMIGPLTITII